jgi:broad specificity phosphatase PhoE
MTQCDERWTSTHRESLDEIYTRVTRFMANLVQRAEENIVVVSHGVFIESCFQLLSPDFLDEKRVYNLDAFACQCVSKDGKFVRLQNIQKI